MPSRRLRARARRGSLSLSGPGGRRETKNQQIGLFSGIDLLDFSDFHI
jgi:hypothetical protein